MSTGSTNYSKIGAHEEGIGAEEKVIQSKALGHVDLWLWVQWGLATCRNARTELIKTSYSLVQSMNPSETCAG